MNIFKKTIAYVSFTMAFMVFGSFLVPTHYSEAAGCAVTSAVFKPLTVSSPYVSNGMLTFNYSANINKTIGVAIQTSGCAGAHFAVKVIEEGGSDTSVSGIENQQYLVPSSEKLDFVLGPTEQGCGDVLTGSECQYKIVVSRNGTELYDSSTYAITGATEGYRLNYDCKDTCANDGVWKLISTTAIKVSPSCALNYKTSFYSNLGPTPLDLRAAENPGLELAVFGTGCIGWTGKVTLEEVDSGSNDDIDITYDFSFDTSGGPTRLAFVAGEQYCEAGTPNCSILATITPYRDGNKGDSYETVTPLNYNCLVPNVCTGTTNETIWLRDENPSNLATPLTSKKPVGILSSAIGCEVISAGFNPYTTKNGVADYELKKIETHGWFWEDKRDVINPVTLTIKTKTCAGSYIFVDVVGLYGIQNSETDPVKVLNGRTFLVPPSESFTIKIIPGEEGCSSGYGADCRFHIQTTTIGITGNKVTHSSLEEPYGNLNYQCDTVCNGSLDESLGLGTGVDSVFWKFAGDTSAKPYASDPLDTAPPLSLEDSGVGAVSPDCLDTTTGKAIDGCYQLYEGFADILKGKFDNVNSIGDFINAIIALAIGLAGIITVGMIMWDGFTYWRTAKAGSTAALSDVKGRIWKRLLGLLLLFTIYTILRTINPDLLNLTPRINAFSLDVFSRTADPDFVVDTNAINVDNITVSASDLEDPTFIAYLAHQQGAAGAASILWAAKKGYATIPSTTPFVTNGEAINKNMKNNYLGSGDVTPANFIDYWAKKVKAVKTSTSTLDPALETELGKAAADTQVSLITLKTLCKIESSCKPSKVTVVNKFGYAGLFQLSNKTYQAKAGVWEKYRKPDGILLGAYDNAYAGGGYVKANLTSMANYKSKIDG